MLHVRILSKSIGANQQPQDLARKPDFQICKHEQASKLTENLIAHFTTTVKTQCKKKDKYWSHQYLIGKKRKSNLNENKTT
jgi:hypothetical protein